MTPHGFQHTVLCWHELHGRKNLPWQTPNDPYRVWVSEIMLQQTQVVTVRGYFEAFMHRFPNLESLAAAQPEEVLSIWAGLGYYARARNLHQCARTLIDKHGGKFPTEQKSLEALPGIGRSTAGAILSLSLGQRAAILDGNVRRLLTRYFRIPGWPGDPKVQSRLWTLSESLVPERHPGTFNQALMDLGSLVCTPRRPSCGDCPLETGCGARADGTQGLYPEKKPPRPKPVRESYFLILRRSGGSYYLETRAETGIWGGLLCLPEFRTLEALKEWLSSNKIESRDMVKLASRRHTFTHFHLDFIPILSDIGSRWPESLLATGSFVSQERLERLPAPIHHLLSSIEA